MKLTDENNPHLMNFMESNCLPINMMNNRSWKAFFSLQITCENDDSANLIPQL